MRDRREGRERQERGQTDKQSNWPDLIAPKTTFFQKYDRLTGLTDRTDK